MSHSHEEYLPTSCRFPLLRSPRSPRYSNRKSEETLRSYSEYVRLVLDKYRPVSEEGMDMGNEGDIPTPPNGQPEEIVKRHVGWLQAIQHNQHAITDDSMFPQCQS